MLNCAWFRESAPVIIITYRMDGNAKQFRHFFYCIHMICLLILHYKWFELLEVKPFFIFLDPKYIAPSTSVRTSGRIRIVLS